MSRPSSLSMTTNPCAERVEDLVRFDLMAEPINVGDDGRADIFRIGVEAFVEKREPQRSGKMTNLRS
jgi:hypothetical protein